MKFTRFLLIICCVMFFVACKQSKKELIIGKWQGVKLENPDLDSFFLQSQQYIDTFGKGNDSTTNMELYGFSNLDSIRSVLQAKHDSSMAEQLNAVKSTYFNFVNDSVVNVTFNGGKENEARWKFMNDNVLVMDEKLANQESTQSKAIILSLTRSELKLKFEQDGSFSTVTFRRAGK